MGRTVGELLRSITYRELMEWYAFNAIDPIGEWRADVRIAQLASVLANVNRDPKAKAEPFTISDFMLFDEPRSETKKDEDDGARMDPMLFAWLMNKSREGDDGR